MAQRRRLRSGSLVYSTDPNKMRYIRELHLVTVYIPSRKDFKIICKGHK